MDFYFKTSYKTALMIMGQLRLEDTNETVRQKYEYHTQMFQYDNLYLWQWKNELEVFQELHNFPCKKLIVRESDNPLLSKEELDFLPEAYQRTWAYYEHIKHPYIHKTVQECKGIELSTTKQFYQIGEMFKDSLEDNDIFIKTRYDLKYKMPFDISTIKDLLITKKPVVCVPIGGDTPKGRGVGDLFYVMNRSAAQLMQDYLEKTIQYAKEGGPFHQESVFRYHLINKNNVDLYRFNFNLTRWHYENLKMNDYFGNYNTNAIYRDNLPHIFEPQD